MPRRVHPNEHQEDRDPNKLNQHLKVCTYHQCADLGFVNLINVIYWHGSNVFTINKLTLFTCVYVKNHIDVSRQLAKDDERGVSIFFFFLAIDVVFF